MISQTQLDEIIHEAEQNPLDEALVARLRAAYPDLHFTLCIEDNMDAAAKPVVERPKFSLYLVDSSDHCSMLTCDLEAASGVVLAEISDED